MKTALTVIFIISSIILIILVLMQEGKEAGLGSLTGTADAGTYWSKNKGRSREGTLIRVTAFFFSIVFCISGNPYFKIYLGTKALLKLVLRGVFLCLRAMGTL